MRRLPRRLLLGAMLPAPVLLAACGPRRGGGAKAPAGQPAAALPLVGLRMTGTAAGWAQGGASLYRTADGGRTWLDVSPPGRPTAGTLVTAFPRPGTAWVALAGAGGITAYASVDGGAHWSSAALPASSGLVPRFLAVLPDARHGWLWGSRGASGGSEPGTLFATADGGQTWTARAAAGGGGVLPTSGVKMGLAFGDATHGVLCGADPRRGVPWLQATADGGATWKAARVPVATPYARAGLALQFPTYFDAEHAALFVFAYTATIPTAVPYTSADGGATFTAALPIASPHAAPVVSYLNAQRWFASDGVGIYATEDAGQGWSAFLASPPKVLQGVAVIDFVSPSLGFALIPAGLGPSGRTTASVLQTVDAGQQWGPAGG